VQIVDLSAQQRERIAKHSAEALIPPDLARIAFP